MPTYEYAEIPMSNLELDEFASEEGLWGDYVPIAIDFDNVKTVAKRILTKRQYNVFLLKSAGFTNDEIAEMTGTTKMNISYHYKALIKKIKNYYK
jgi:DNA-binding NarL/FixJ family response regulator